jgi:hypothetical protein
MKDFIDKTAEQSGTKINRRNLLAIQGFIGSTVYFNEDGSVVETNEYGETLTTQFNENGTITQTFSGERTVVKTTTFNADGSITEALS